MTKGFCPENNKPGGCQLPNIHCGYPDCDNPPQHLTPKIKKRSRKQVMEEIGQLQDLIGHALAAFQNDRDPMQADKVTKALEKAFNLAVRIRD